MTFYATHFIKCVVTNTEKLQPTLWRTCRVLANRTRLEMLRLLFQGRGLCVSAVAERLDLKITQASQHLRALESRGLLKVRRQSRWVYYEAPPPNSGGPAGPLVEALRCLFQKKASPTEAVFRLATAFTHPRRIAIFRALQPARGFQDLQKQTGVPTRALERHLRKLMQRGFVIRRTDLSARFAQGQDGGILAHALAQMAVQ